MKKIKLFLISLEIDLVRSILRALKIKDDTSIRQEEEKMEKELESKGLGLKNAPNPTLPTKNALFAAMDKKVGLTYDKKNKLRGIRTRADLFDKSDREQLN